MKSNTWICEYAIGQKGRPYWYGTFGQVSSETLYKQKKAQYPAKYTATDYASQYGKKVHDCAGLLKGALWCDTVNGAPTYNANQDLSANGFINSGCSETGPISSIPEIPGLVVWKEGHLGIYIGAGKVVEARGHAYGVVETSLKDRGWLKWGKCKWVDYSVWSYTAEQAMADIKKVVDRYYANK